MEQFVVYGGKKLRKGYTTGSCAAAAAKAAVTMLVTQQTLDQVAIDTPAGVRLTLPVTDSVFEHDTASCAVVKDGGDDPDVTHGLKIVAQARWGRAGIIIEAGEGIGRVTLPGLKVAVGQPAINPVPLQMIRKEVGEVAPPGRGITIRLSVPGGEEAARRTFNPRLGVMGGISILGSKGLVEPMSEEALKESLALELAQKRQQGAAKAVLVFGNYGEDFAVQKLGVAPDYVIKMGNYVGFMLDQAAAHGLERVLLVGHLGKLVKVAAGIFQTHSRIADARLEILCAYAALAGAAFPVVQALARCTTSEAALELLEAQGLTAVCQRVVDNAARRCTEYTRGQVAVGAVLFDGAARLLAQDASSAELIGELQR